MVDEPQGFKSSVPPVAAVTSPDLAIVRFHGRNADTWEAKGIPPVERFRYLYARDELGEWVPRIRQAAREARETHVLMNNCYANYGTTNAREIARLLEDLDQPGLDSARARQSLARPVAFPLVDHCRSLPGTTEDIKWENDLVFSVGGKMYAMFDPARPDTPSLKCDAFDFARLTTLDGIRPAAYLARAGWVALVERPDALPLDETIALLTKSHDLVMAQPPEAQVQASLA